MIDKYGVGASPAAVYLVTILNERNDRALARKITKFLADKRAILHDVVGSHLYSDQMTRKTFASLLEMLDAQFRQSAAQYAARYPEHAHAWSLVVNVLIGELKVQKNRGARAAHEQREEARFTPSHVTVKSVKAREKIGDETAAERVDRLRKKSRLYLERKGKLNTLY
jgi:hypothetical protein